MAWGRTGDRPLSEAMLKPDKNPQQAIGRWVRRGVMTLRPAKVSADHFYGIYFKMWVCIQMDGRIDEIKKVAKCLNNMLKSY